MSLRVNIAFNGERSFETSAVVFDHINNKHTHMYKNTNRFIVKCKAIK